MARADIKTCKYKDCKHATRTINLNKDSYVCIGRQFYHADCFEEKNVLDEKKNIESADMQLIKNLWIEHISPTVSISLLFKVLREYLDRGVSSDYLVFVMNYVIKNHYKLNYPFGFRYYVDNARIKAEYRNKLRKSVPQDAFVAVEPQEESTHKKFSVPHKPSGFSSILGGKS